MKKQTIAVGVIILITLILCIAALPVLPAQIPIHWDASGRIDNWCDKAFLLLFPVLQAAIALGMKQVQRIDPHRDNYKRFASTCHVFVMVLILLVFGLCLLTVISAWNPNALNVPMAITLGVGLLFAVMGNLMPKLRQNYFIGIKTPWALEDEENWRKTHRMAGRLWFGAGIVMMLFSLLPKELLMLAVLCIAVTIAGLPYVYSYSLFHNKRTKGEKND